MASAKVLSILLLCSFSAFSIGCRIGAFNIKSFGLSKHGRMQNEAVVEVLVKTAVRYDVLLIQEIRDISGEAIRDLLARVNADSPHRYEMTISDRLGRTSYKEQYAFFYRSSDINVLDSYHYDDGSEAAGTDTFEREPYIVSFDMPKCFSGPVAMIAIHVKPSQAVEEINLLDDVADEVSSRYNTDNVLIMGDLNADCSYVTDDDWPDIQLDRTRFTWLIPDSADTTVSTGTNCAYDRFVTYKSSALSHVTGSVFRFDREFALSYEEARDVSDHYPVDLVI